MHVGLDERGFPAAGVYLYSIGCEIGDGGEKSHTMLRSLREVQVRYAVTLLLCLAKSMKSAVSGQPIVVSAAQRSEATVDSPLQQRTPASSYGAMELCG